MFPSRSLRDLRAAVADLTRPFRNQITFRGKPPQVGELLMIPRREIELRASPFVPRRHCVGKIMPRGWQPNIGPIEHSTKISRCLQHWRDGVTWEETGIYDHMMHRINESRSRQFDGCRTIEDVRARYLRLDRIYRKVAAERALDPNPEGTPDFHMQWGIIVHLGPGGVPLFGGGGCHRMAMAIALDLDHVPALLGYTHRSAAPALARYRKLTDSVFARRQLQTGRRQQADKDTDGPLRA